MAKVAKRRGRYVLDYYDDHGKRVRKTLPTGTTLKKAKDKLREIEDQLAKGLYIPDEKIPTFSKVAEEWLKKKKPELRDSTWHVYEGHTKNHFNAFDDIRIDRITIAMIEEWITERQNEEMPIATIRKILVSMGQILKFAVRHKYISYNPFPDAERPRGRVKTDSVMILKPDQLTAFLDAVSDQKYKTLFMLAIFSGARQGELLGLKWPDMDGKNNQIHIQRTFNHQTFYDTKTETSNRRIDLGPKMMAELKKWRVACLPNKLDLMFPNEEGQPMNYSNMVQRYYMPALKKAKIKRIKFHCLRHTFASLLIHQGENIKYIQSQLGHSSPTVTLNIYSHLMNAVNQESACRLEKTILNGSGHKMVTT
ncbi:MAG: site-specific integrase [Desulfosarcina sp.]|nr:site-specific integrase [Desulfosarcina sp.]